MNDVNAIALLSSLGVGNAELHGDWVRASCPLAFHRHKAGKDSNPSFGIRYNPDGKSGYHCFGCNLRSKDVGDLVIEVIYALKHANYPPPPMDIALATKISEGEGEAGYKGGDWTGKVVHAVEKSFEEWPLWWLESFPLVFKIPEAMAYLNSRGIQQWLWQELDIRFDPTRKAVCFPFYNSGKKFAGMRGRFLYPKGDFRYYDYTCNGVNNTKLVFMGENHVDFMSPVVVVEGPFDYVRVYPVFKNVLCNLGASLSQPKVKKLESALEVIGFFDDDEAGVIASQILQQRLGYSYRSVVYPEHAKGEKLDPEKLSNKQIVDMLTSV